MTRIYFNHPDCHQFPDCGPCFGLKPDVEPPETREQASALYASGKCERLGEWYQCQHCEAPRNKWLRHERDAVALIRKDYEGMITTGWLCVVCWRIAEEMARDAAALEMLRRKREEHAA